MKCCNRTCENQASPGRCYCCMACSRKAATRCGYLAHGTVGAAKVVEERRAALRRAADAVRAPRPLCGCGRGELLPSRDQCAACFAEGRPVEAAR